jgi:broad specificity phosphatase PhoE
MIQEVLDMPDFPSVEWFKAVADLLNASDSFKRLGTCDCQMGVKVDDRYFEIDFEAFEITTVQEIDAAKADQLDFTLVQDYDAWKAMIEDIKANGRAEHEFTLNSLDLKSEREFAVGQDYNRRDAFYRFNQTLQDYFDLSSQVETTFVPRLAVTR